jgi:hypothetical protein
MTKQEIKTLEDDNDDQEVVIIEEDEQPVLEDKTLKQENHDDEGDHEDESPEQRYRREKTEQNRKARLERKEKKKQFIGKTLTENNAIKKLYDEMIERNIELEKRLSEQEKRSQNHEISLVDQNLNELKQRVEMSDRVFQKAIESGNGEDAAKALKIRDEANARITELSNYKQNAAQRTFEPSKRQPAVDPVVKTYYEQFSNENPWFDPNGGNEESAIALAIDASLLREGYKLNTEEYWDELQERLERRIPERFEEKSEKRKVRGGPSLPSSKNNTTAGGKREFHLSAARKKALIDAGVWDDPIARKRRIDYYIKYDQEKAARGE